jgi:glycosyltransferase involved in cell wall biosynthesis
MATIHAIDVVLPAHNEEEAIGDVLREFYRIAHEKDGIDLRLVVAEDGSTDRTREVVETVGQDFPVLLLAKAPRKGYSRGVLDGLRATSAPLISFSDSDGQCDPSDLVRLLNHLDGFDMVVGYRKPRGDSLFRRAISRAFRVVYEALFPVRLHDPSCPFLIIRREALSRVLEGSPGILRQGFWWEFNARANAAGLHVNEIPVHHRTRTAGKTQVYHLQKVPRIAIEHIRGLFQLRRELIALKNWRTDDRSLRRVLD